MWNRVAGSTILCGWGLRIGAYGQSRNVACWALTREPWCAKTMMNLACAHVKTFFPPISPGNLAFISAFLPSAYGRNVPLSDPWILLHLAFPTTNLPLRVRVDWVAFIQVLSLLVAPCHEVGLFFVPPSILAIQPSVSLSTCHKLQYQCRILFVTRECRWSHGKYVHRCEFNIALPESAVWNPSTWRQQRNDHLRSRRLAWKSERKNTSPRPTKIHSRVHKRRYTRIPRSGVHAQDCFGLDDRSRILHVCSM